MLLRFATCLSEKSGCYILYNLILNAIHFHQTRKGHRYTFFFFSLNLVLIGFPGPYSSRKIWSSFFSSEKVVRLGPILAPLCWDLGKFRLSNLGARCPWVSPTLFLRTLPWNVTRTTMQSHHCSPHAQINNWSGKLFCFVIFFSVFGIVRQAEYNILWSQLIVNPVWSQSDRSGKFSPELDPIIEMSQKDRFQRGHRFIFFVLIFVLFDHLSLPASIGWVALSFLVCLSRYGDIQKNLHFLSIYMGIKALY